MNCCDYANKIAHIERRDDMGYYDKFYTCTRHESYIRSLVRFLKVKSILDYVKLESGSLVLDLGCGLGDDLRVFSMFGMVAVGVDYNRVGLKRAKKKAAHFILADVKNLPFDKEVFDIIYSCDLSTFSRKSSDFLVKFIDEISTILKKNGLLVLLYSSNFSGMRHTSSWMHHRKEFFAGIFRKSIFGSNFCVFLAPLVMFLGKNHFQSFLRDIHNLLDKSRCRSWIIIIVRK